MLRIGNLRVGYPGSARPVLDGLNLELAAGEAVGIFGDSGAGKSTLARAIPRLLPAAASVEGEIDFQGKNLLRMTPGEMRGLRGAQIGLVPQEPSMALNPVAPAGQQVEEVLRAHRATGAGKATMITEAALTMLRRFFGAEAGRIAGCYPHQLSGGERQRVTICQAIVCGPALLIADEPTSALDSVARKDFLDLLRQLRHSAGLSLLLVSHDRAALRYVADRCLELRAGRLRGGQLR